MVNVGGVTASFLGSPHFVGWLIVRTGSPRARAL